MKKVLIAVAALAVLFSVTPAQAQLQSTGGINVTVEVTQQSTITLTTGGSLTIDPTTGQSGTINFNTVWNIGPASAVNLYAYFSSATAALSTTGGSNVSSSQIAATATNPNASYSNQVCNAAPGAGFGVVDGASCPAIQLAHGSADGSSGLSTTNPNNNGPQGGINTTFSLSIPNFAAQKFAAGAYSGTLNAVVVAI